MCTCLLHAVKKIPSSGSTLKILLIGSKHQSHAYFLFLWEGVFNLKSYQQSLGKIYSLPTVDYLQLSTI